MEKASQLSIPMENVPGQLGRLCRILTQANVNIRGISISESSDFSTIRVILSDPAAARKALREAGLTFAVQDVLIAEVTDKPGALECIAQRLGEVGINVQYVYGVANGTAGHAKLVLHVDDVDRARQALGDL